ncbi:hypothetical protein SLEP1_g47795 [Rubroshorea leprosula]|uniref:Serine-threonine/tyrosine-protein kinase catalytic domain-containing protein n=1 Tax=Rubroshorea leprosula TaxID=152421 RepID=A0AAV5LRS9_9ROSI|nr:hypothetical protein SLEP1_g47795 [Rubroshorea leprosula]
MPMQSRAMETYGYCAPEYSGLGQLISKADVYSFGVVLLELITGRRASDTTRPIDEQNLVTWVAGSQCSHQATKAAGNHMTATAARSHMKKVLLYAAKTLRSLRRRAAEDQRMVKLQLIEIVAENHMMEVNAQAQTGKAEGDSENEVLLMRATARKVLA